MLIIIMLFLFVIGFLYIKNKLPENHSTKKPILSPENHPHLIYVTV